MDISLVKRMIAEQRPFRSCDISLLLGLDLTKHVLETAPEGYGIPKEDAGTKEGERIVYLQNAGPEIVQTAVSQKQWANQKYFYYRPLKVYEPTS
ncbi:MAG: hypothetical protein ABH828_00800 [archaeon]